MWQAAQRSAAPTADGNAGHAGNLPVTPDAVNVVEQSQRTVEEESASVNEGEECDVPTNSLVRFMYAVPIGERQAPTLLVSM